MRVVVAIAAVTVLVGVILVGCGGGGTSTSTTRRTAGVQGRPSPSPRPRPRQHHADVDQVGTAGPGMDWAGSYLTTDGGRHWQSFEGRPGAPRQIGSIDFVNSRDGWLSTKTAGPGLPSLLLYRTTDGGRSWQRGRVAEGGSLSIGRVSFAFADPKVGYALIGGETMPFTYASGYLTTDGGRRWRRAPAAPGNGEVAFTGRRLWLSINEWGDELFRSTDDGLRWTRLRMPLGAGREVAYGTPIELGGGRLVFPAVDHSRIFELYVREAGGWRRLYRTRLHGSYGGGTGRSAVVLRPPSSLLLGDPGKSGFTVLRVHGDQVDASHLETHGLRYQTGVVFGDRRHGIAVLNGECEACVYFTGDGGADWHRRDVVVGKR